MAAASSSSPGTDHDRRDEDAPLADGGGPEVRGAGPGAARRRSQRGTSTGPVWPGAAGTLAPMDRPPPDPAKLLNSWMEWERGETTPGQVMKNLKTGGLRELLEHLVEGGPR